MTPGWTSVDRADPLDDPGEQHDREVRRVLADPVVGERHELVASGRQPHRAPPVHRAAAVDVAPGQLELERRAQQRRVARRGPRPGARAC